MVKIEVNWLYSYTSFPSKEREMSFSRRGQKSRLS